MDQFEIDQSAINNMKIAWLEKLHGVSHILHNCSTVLCSACMDQLKISDQIREHGVVYFILSGMEITSLSLVGLVLTWPV